MDKEKKTLGPMLQASLEIPPETILSLMPAETNWTERGRQMLKLIGEEAKRQFPGMKETGEEVSAGDFEELFSAGADERLSDVDKVKNPNITVDHSQFFGTVRVFENADPWKVIEWFGKNRSEPESDAVMDDCIFVTFPDGSVITGTAINRWIKDMVYGDLSKGTSSQTK